MFFRNWYGVERILIVGLCAYAALVIILRISGKRTLSKMNAFDFIVTVALGSTLASVIMSKEVPLAEGLSAMVVLIGLQWLVAWLAVRSPSWRRLIKSEPRLLAWQGQLDETALQEERMSAEAVYSAARSAGLASLAEATAVVLETDGTVSVIRSPVGDASALRGVRGFSSASMLPAQSARTGDESA